MKIRSLSFLLLFISQTAPAASFFEPPPVHRETLSNGAVLFILEDHELPTVEVIVFIRNAGSINDPKGKEGLAGLAMEGMRLGGTGKRPSGKIEEELESVGASLEMGADLEWGFASLRILKKDLERGFEILFDLFRNPGFEPDQIELLKKKFAEKILRGDEDPLTRGIKELKKQVYGTKISLGRPPTPKSIRKIRRQDLIDFHKRYLSPDRLVIAAGGDLTPAGLNQTLKIQTAGWSSSPAEAAAPPAVKKEFSAGQWFVNKKGLKQATLLVGHLGERRDNPDKFALYLMDYLLGGSGSLSSRLGEKIRTEGGKAYGVWSHYGVGQPEGLFYAAAQTENSRTKEVMEEMTQMIREMAELPEITEDEITRAREAALTHFFFLYETSFQLVKDLARFYLWGYPENYLEIFQREISSLTKEDVERVSRKYLRPDGLKKVVVADPSVLNAVKSLGKFKVIKK